ncbi:MAG: glutamine--fructose-6-phosphate transaminase (isomerizing) [Geminicoccaceae bacterium]|nr:glutamine--fructose-6-phosphate transaminase (isomerizing) [Geminicoccaceae bacterium]MCS7268650.1 glutamine--fructose-6-phosphate transaminase (isomerizing) [Geminicoccaceae bacterium]MCX7630967.1 glutamine--fructose-6-phosphate transaminase (isomerizing) [Geminicoccaceae bacterium]MDW8124713.1 glutamine--fructose-6-phosphate transaminase (isomerizing) [Geminicoccaceae bacterium]MDW8341523.1 glutamine--fructose-6-phosphate transaminase (isomerizing) [Geminicoccaceae bacterium]
MCGIVGVIGRQPAAPLLLEALRRLEYRGYDSAGIATLVEGRIERRRASGKLDRLAAKLAQEPLPGTTGIGHTRWATHGAPTEDNAHPHIVDGVAIVHNGIIENFAELRAELVAKGRRFESQTDTEVVPHLVCELVARGLPPEEAARAAIRRLEGAFALALLFRGREDLIVAARKGAPLAIGYGEGEMYVGSDALALAPLTRRIQYLEDGDVAIITISGARIFDARDRPVERPIVQTALSGALIGKGNYRHFMEKEIFEQPAVIGDTLRSFADPATHRIVLPALPFDLSTVPRLLMCACGTAAYAGLVGKYWFEKLARLPVDWDIASEFRYRDWPLVDEQAGVFVSQSGETADTLAAMRHVKALGHKTLAIVNVPESTLARESDGVLRTLAGPEIGVASTKAFTTQLATLACLAIGTARARRLLPFEREAALVQALDEVPARMHQVLERSAAIQAIAEEIADARDVLYIGRGPMYPIALEGALKLKEISYIHAEGYAAGELKHGPIALVAEGVPVIVVCPSDELFEKTASNLQEVRARGGRVVLLSDRAGVAKLGDYVWRAIELPAVDPFVAPLLYAVPIQLLAYHVAVTKGTDVDQPRNLAKSVTVE